MVLSDCIRAEIDYIGFNLSFLFPASLASGHQSRTGYLLKDLQIAGRYRTVGSQTRA